MKSLMYLFAIFAFLANAAVVSAEDLETRSFSVGGFSEIENRTPGSVKLIQGPETSVTAEAGSEVFEHLEVKTSGGKLILKVKEKRRSFFGWLSDPIGNERLKFTVTTPTVNAVSLHASGNLESGPLKTESLSLSIHGSGNMKIESIDASDDLSVGVFGSGEIETGEVSAASMTSGIHGSGEVTLGALLSQTSKFSVHGSGDVRVAELRGERVEIAIHGSGDIRLPKVDLKTIEGSIHGSGDIRLGGKADSLNVRTHGLGNVSTDGLDADRIVIK